MSGIYDITTGITEIILVVMVVYQQLYIQRLKKELEEQKHDSNTYTGDPDRTD